MERPTLPPGTGIGTVHLRVAELDRSLAFYQDVLGLRLLAEDGASASLGSGFPRPLVVLHAAPDAAAPGAGAPGLYHVAFLLPSRVALASLVRRVQAAGWSLNGVADHNVSEAVYLSDPDGIGVELYADRAPNVWRTVDGRIFITTEPLDLAGLLAIAPEPAEEVPEGTRVGHVHLRTASLEDAEAFYVGRLGFEVVTRRIPGALFVAAGGYHHHVGLNVWGISADSPPSDGHTLGLVSFEILVPEAAVRRALLAGRDEGFLVDGDGNGVRIVGGSGPRLSLPESGRRPSPHG